MGWSSRSVMAHRLASANGGRSCAVKEYLATLDDAAFGAASEVTPKFVSRPTCCPMDRRDARTGA